MPATPRVRPACFPPACVPLSAALLVMLLAGAAGAQEATLSMPTSNGKTPVSIGRVPIDPSDPSQKPLLEFNKRKAVADQALKKIRGKHFGMVRRVEIRQAGILKIRQLTDPAAFGPMLDVFADEQDDVRNAILDHLADQQTNEGDSALAWAAVFGNTPAHRTEAIKRLKARVAQLKETPVSVESVVATGLASRKPSEVAAAGHVVRNLGLFPAIPMMIAGQIQGGGGGGYYGGQPDDPSLSLAYILVGTQRTYVADLTPVVGENAVAFDPQIGVITEGTVLRVINAFVFTYNGDLHRDLVGMTSDAWGQSTAHLGWDQKAWLDWYDQEFKPYLAKKDAEAKRAGAASPAGGPDGLADPARP